MRPLRTPVLLLSGVAALLLSACAADSGTASSPSPTADPLTGSSWVLDSILIGSVLEPSAADASLNFGAEGQLSGSTGCNRFTGSWEGDAGALTLTLGGTTMMACVDPAAQAQEQAVLAELPRAKSASIGNERLTLKDEGGADLAVYSAAVSDFAGTSWQVTGVNNGAGAVVTTDATTSLTITFGTDASVTGFAGCTDFTATYTADGEALAFADIAPAGECGDGAEAAAAQEEFLAALGNVEVAHVDGTSVTLRDGGGATQVSLTAAA